jgi:hypothetical protein
MKRRFVIKRLLIVWDANEVQITFLGPAPGLKPSKTGGGGDGRVGGRGGGEGNGHRPPANRDRSPKNQAATRRATRADGAPTLRPSNTSTKVLLLQDEPTGT